MAVRRSLAGGRCPGAGACLRFEGGIGRDLGRERVLIMFYLTFVIRPMSSGEKNENVLGCESDRLL